MRLLTRAINRNDMKAVSHHFHLCAIRNDLSTALGFRDYVLVLLDTGIRVSELCGVTLDDLHGGYLKVFGKARW